MIPGDAHLEDYVSSRSHKHDSNAQPMSKQRLNLSTLDLRSLGREVESNNMHDFYQNMQGNEKN
ncbi:hypothetical protein Syun_021170 [Stephania yunnanensis]|uniref:Uncharacterized protein n=1 Tax=Stephania yunnanensis TaxID=152371 RepID=A0AAP0IFA7_9MAGN